MNRRINLVFTLGFLITLLIGLTRCETSGSLRNKPQSQSAKNDVVEDHEEEIKTVDNPKLQRPQNDELEKELALAKGRLAEIEALRQKDLEISEKRIKELEEQNAKLLEEISKNGAATGTADVESKNKDDSGAKLLWDKALEQSKNGKFETAASLFQEITKQYPTHSGSFFAALGVGFSQYALKDYKEAVLTFNEILDKYPKHKRQSLAAFSLGASFAMMKQNSEAKLFFEESVEKAPQSNHGKLASAILKKTAKVPQNLFTTFPNWYK